MEYCTTYTSSLGDIFISADDEGVTGLWFAGQKHGMPELQNMISGEDNCFLMMACDWLDQYFEGKNPTNTVPVHLKGSDFQKEVWGILRSIPYGQVISYGDIAKTIAENRGIARMAAQAIGGAVGRNPVSILVPCHRVVGSKGSLTGYAGGIEKKRALLVLEGVAVSEEGYIKR